jgi:hypothetical protein
METQSMTENDYVRTFDGPRIIVDLIITKMIAERGGSAGVRLRKT